MLKPLTSALLTLTLSFCFHSEAGGGQQAPGENPLQPYRGEWRLDVEQSYARALTLEELAQYEPEYLRSQIVGMSRIVSLAIGDSTIAFTRGRHRRDLAFRVDGADSLGVTLMIAEEPDSIRWNLSLDEGGYLQLGSTRSGFIDYYVYFRADSTTPALVDPSELGYPK